MYLTSLEEAFSVENVQLISRQCPILYPLKEAKNQ